MMHGQLELGFGNVTLAANGRYSRRAKAQWWFAQMRQVVNRAFDWQPAPEPRPEQIWLDDSSQATAHRHRPYRDPVTGGNDPMKQ